MVAATAAVADSWDSIKDYTYEKRVEFTASFDRMTAKMDDQTRDMKAKAATLSDTATKDRDQAMLDFTKARADFKSSLADLGNATADTWADSKEKVGQAWQKRDAAFATETASATPAVAANQSADSSFPSNSRHRDDGPLKTVIARPRGSDSRMNCNLGHPALVRWWPICV